MRLQFAILSTTTYDDTTLEHLRKAHLDGICTDANFSISVSVRHDQVQINL